MRSCAVRLAAFVSVVAGALAPLDAGSSGTRVQLAPSCNVLTITVRDSVRGLTAAGVDDRCGMGAPAPVSGRALRHDDGTLRIALYVHDGREMQLVSLQLDAAGRVGTWHDSAGRAGTAAAPGSAARPRWWRARPAQVAVTPGSGLFFPRNGCTYGRQFLRLHQGQVICDDVVTQVPFEAADMALGADGHPVFAGPGVGGAGVVVTRCGNPACSAGNTLSPLSTTGSGPRIAVGADGLPVVAMVSSGAITVTRCDDPGCASGVETTVADAGLVSALTIGSDGLPLVVGSSASGLVRVIHCGDPACASGNTVEDLALPNALASEPAVAIAPGGLPVIAFRYQVPLPFPQVENGVRVHLCADLTCSTGTTSAPVLLNTDSTMTQFCCGLSLAIGVDGQPIVASHRMFWGLWVAHCDDGACGSSTSGAKNDDQYLPGVDVNLMIGALGTPLLSHRGANDSSVRVTACGDVACTDPGQPTRTIAIGAGHRASVLGSEGMPVVASAVAGGGQMIACGTRDCQLPALPLSPVPGPLRSRAQGR